jgi:RNA polymerase sigma-70 factor (ECF subfamily)
LQVEKTQERQRVRSALAQMKPRSARLLLLRHTGLSYAEIAAALEIAPGSVGTLLARAEAEFEREYRRQEEGG